MKTTGTCKFILPVAFFSFLFLMQCGEDEAHGPAPVLLGGIATVFLAILPTESRCHTRRDRGNKAASCRREQLWANRISRLWQ